MFVSLDANPNGFAGEEEEPVALPFEDCRTHSSILHFPDGRGNPRVPEETLKDEKSKRHVFSVSDASTIVMMEVSDAGHGADLNG